MKNDASQKEGPVFLALSEWELANLHLRPATTVTFYAGAAPIEFLRHRVALVLGQNPWLTGRLVKATTADGVVALAYNDSGEVLPSVDDHFFVYGPDEVSLSLAWSYEELVQSLLPVQCADSKEAIDADEPLFKVAVVPVETGDDSGETPLQSRVRLPGFALVVSMNHTIGDGHTYYSLFGMLDADTQVEALDPIRVPGFEKAKTAVIGETESALLTSVGLGLGIVGTYLLSKLVRRAPQNVSVHTVDPAWIIQEKVLTSIWNTGVVFRPRAGELGMLMITRRFDNDVLAHRKKEQGRFMPMGQRLI